MLATLLAHQTNGALSDFGGKLAWLAHGSILSRVGASTKSGALHIGLMKAVDKFEYRDAVGSFLLMLRGGYDKACCGDLQTRVGRFVFQCNARHDQ
jgi:hypothetical protein